MAFSSPISLDSVACLAGLLVIYRVCVSLSQRYRNPPHPPGPPGLPLIGNLSIPKDPAHETYLEWTKIYGSFHILSANVSG